MVNVDNNVCENIVMWDGDPKTWQRPDGTLMLVQETTPAKNWQYDPDSNTYVLAVTGYGQIGFTWDGTYLTTNIPQPSPPVQPEVSGAQPL